MDVICKHWFLSYSVVLRLNLYVIAQEGLDESWLDLTMTEEQVSGSSVQVIMRHRKKNNLKLQKKLTWKNRDQMWLSSVFLKVIHDSGQHTIMEYIRLQRFYLFPNGHLFKMCSGPSGPSNFELKKLFNMMRDTLNSAVFLLFQINLRVRRQVYVPAATTWLSRLMDWRIWVSLWTKLIAWVIAFKRCLYVALNRGYALCKEWWEQLECCKNSTEGLSWFSAGFGQCSRFFVVAEV